MWYDEENGVYQILDNETVLDKEKQTVSYKTTHFSKYMVVDKNIWYNTWRTNIDYRVGTTTKLYYDFAFVVDTSGSMEGQRIEYAKQSMNNFVDCLTDNDNACLVSFESNAYLKARLGATKETLHTAINSLNAYGGTYVSSGLNMALNQLIASTSGNQKAIVLICDGDVDSVQSYVNIAKANNIKIFAINVISADNDILQSMADETGGEYYYAYTAEELLTAFSHISSESLFNFDLTDTDGDGLPDTFEKNGMRLANGKIVYTAPNKPDTDGDGLTDGEEMGILRRSGVLIFPSLELPFKPLFNNNMYIGKGAYSSSALYFNNKSDPSNGDSDGDNLYDNEDPYPFEFNTFKKYDRDAVIEYCDKYAKNPNTDVYNYFQRGDCANFASQCVHAGGIEMDEDWYFKEKGFGFFGLFYVGDDFSQEWTVAYNNYLYFKNNIGLTNGEEIVFNSKEEMQEALKSKKYNIQPGDLMYMQWDEEEPHHATVIYSVNSNTLNYSAHTDAHRDADVNDLFWKNYPDGKLYILHIKDTVITS